MKNNTTVAIKVEGPFVKNKRKRDLLTMEISVLKSMQNSEYACQYIACGRITFQYTKSSQTYDYMVMQLLGPNLSKLRKKYKKFSLATTALIGKQMLHGIKDCHTCGVVHRDIKPGNFCIDNSKLIDGRPRCCIIDFGLCRSYVNANGEVKEARRSVGFRGTAAYASINAHDGKDLGRVDDLWSLFYVLVEFVTGSLPWKGKQKEEVAIYKRQMTNYYLVANLPTPFSDMLQYLKTLKFKDEPDYDLLEGMLDELFRISGQPYDIPYDWDMPQLVEESINSESYVSNKPLASFDNDVNGNVVSQEAVISSPSQNAILTPPFSPLFSSGSVTPYDRNMLSPSIIPTSPAIEHKTCTKALLNNSNHDVNRTPVTGDVKIPATAQLTKLLNEDSSKKNVIGEGQRPTSTPPQQPNSNPRFLKFLIPN